MQTFGKQLQLAKTNTLKKGHRHNFRTVPERGVSGQLVSVSFVNKRMN